MNRDLFGNVLTDDKPPGGLGRRDHLTFRGNVALGRHGWLRLTPAYSLHLVRELLSQSRPDDFVLEPFCGTGTTPLVCASQGIRCHALDINPFLVWLGNLKLTRFDDGSTRSVRAAASCVADAARDAGPAAWKPELHQIEKWWDPATLNTLAALFEAINHISKVTFEGISDLLRVAFCLD